MCPIGRHLFPEWFAADSSEQNITDPEVFEIGQTREFSGKIGPARLGKVIRGAVQPGNTILVIGQNAQTQNLQFLPNLREGLSLRFVFLTRWSDWSISVWPDRFDFQLTERKTSVRLTKVDIARVIYLGLPEFPESRECDHEFLILEYSSVLFSVMALCDPTSYSRMEAVYSGQSDEEVCYGEISIWKDLFRLFPKEISWREAFCQVGNVQILCEDGTVVSRDSTVPVARSSLWLLRLRNDKILPLYATIPPWIHGLYLQRRQGWNDSLFPASKKAVFTKDTCRDREPTVLLLGETEDAVLHQVSKVAPLVGARVTFLDQSNTYKMSAESFGQLVLESDLVVNRFSPSQLRDEVHALNRYRHFWILRSLEATRTLIVNRPSSGATNFSRSVNLMQLKALGWTIPQSVASNDPDVAQSFIESCGGRAVCKPCSAMRADVSRLTVKVIKHLERVAYCPVMFQRYVAGNEYRVHATPFEAHAIEISKGAFRFNRRATYSVAQLNESQQLSRLCQETTNSLGLALSGIDTRKERGTGVLFALECNSMPAFTAFGARHATEVMRSLLDLREEE